MNYVLIYCVVLGIFLQSAYARYTSCGGGKLITVAVDSCPDLKNDSTAPCELKRGTNVTMSVTFSSVKDSKKLNAVVHGIIAGVPVPFPFDHPDGCDKSGITCPISTGQTYTYKAVLAISSSYPSIECSVKWELQDDNHDDEFCLVILVKIT
ncbi:epididymal secretory protein E1 [Lingula anatina]|uniref:Epididymal secretory protein E1 n=1 Tax=Lingula anatina TaxID=7574 RepID=A0A1S3IPL0_LINAN|nr:epididymal secretory protein E1 [Lingula anatina]|eukprot:XP_013400008.1 epididymal secretory protein E1 [Lingula anatina]